LLQGKYGGYRIEATITQWMAAANAVRRQQDTFDRTMLINGFTRKIGTARKITAALPKQRPGKRLIQPNQTQQKALHLVNASLRF
jgi:hypothetical protein